MPAAGAGVRIALTMEGYGLGGTGRGLRVNGDMGEGSTAPQKRRQPPRAPRTASVKVPWPHRMHPVPIARSRVVCTHAHTGRQRARSGAIESAESFEYACTGCTRGTWALSSRADPTCSLPHTHIIPLPPRVESTSLALIDSGRGSAPFVHPCRVG